MRRGILPSSRKCQRENGKEKVFDVDKGERRKHLMEKRGMRTYR
jgi:hypothetical protein